MDFRADSAIIMILCQSVGIFVYWKPFIQWAVWFKTRKQKYNCDTITWYYNVTSASLLIFWDCLWDSYNMVMGSKAWFSCFSTDYQQIPVASGNPTPRIWRKLYAGGDTGSCFARSVPGNFVVTIKNRCFIVPVASSFTRRAGKMRPGTLSWRAYDPSYRWGPCA